MVQNILTFSQRWLGDLSEVLLIFGALLVGLTLVAVGWQYLKGANRKLHGTALGAPLVIFITVAAVFITGYKTPQPLVGDEVTHFYMLKTQADDLSKPNFHAHIPLGTGVTEVRRYPHSFLWHYFGAAVYYLSGQNFIAVQLYQTFFLAQLLVVAYLLARSRGGVQSRSALVYVVLVASLPVVLLFSVTFYQDVPMSAQVLTAFYLLDRRRWLLASAFMAFALGLKVTAILFFPAFFVLLAYRLVKETSLAKGLVYFVCSLILVLGFTWGLGKTINLYAKAEFYPQKKLEMVVGGLKNKVSRYFKVPERETLDGGSIAQPEKKFSGKTGETSPVIIANHPGDLRIKENYLIYGGVVLWIAVGGFMFSIVFVGRLGMRESGRRSGSSAWLWLTGGSYLVFTAWLSRTAPDARFFLPGLVFILLPISEWFIRLPKPRLLITVLTALALLQGGLVLAKTARLRTLSPATLEAVDFLREHAPVPGRIFMYPEGNYRYFPVPHEWYLGYRLREFWRGDNEKRIEMLNAFGVGAIVIKKYLISEVDENITNLGVYPTGFVEDLRNDPRFAKVFENSHVLIYSLPPELNSEW